MNVLAKAGTIWVIRGIASVVFGVLTLLSPGASIAALVLLYGAYALADGAILLGFAFRPYAPKVHYIVSGLLSIVAGALTFMFPGLTAVSLYLLIGAWAVGTGLVELAIALAIRKGPVKVGGLVLAGVLSVACGVALIALPVAGIMALVSFVAAYAIANGAFLIGNGIRIHNFDRPVHATA
jgi:uncharacterized membrane protein HdeD (DUF308 family)